MSGTGDVLDAAASAPVTITRHRKLRYVLMSAKRYERMTDGGETQAAHTLGDMAPEPREAPVAALERDLAASSAARS